MGAHLLKQSISVAHVLTPKETFESLYELVVQNQLTRHTLVSLIRVAVGLLWALVLGVPIGLGIGPSRALDNSITSAFQFLRMISPLSGMPLAVMVFGLGDATISFLLIFVSIWPIFLKHSAGVR